VDTGTRLWVQLAVKTQLQQRDKETQIHGGKETRTQGDTESRRHRYTESRRHRDTESRRQGHKETQIQSQGDTDTRSQGGKETQTRSSASSPAEPAGAAVAPRRAARAVRRRLLLLGDGGLGSAPEGPGRVQLVEVGVRVRAAGLSAEGQRLVQGGPLLQGTRGGRRVKTSEDAELDPAHRKQVDTRSTVTFQRSKVLL